METKKKELQPIELPENTEVTLQMSMPQVIQYALQNNAGVEQLEKMMELQERYEKREAEKAYHVAMAAFKSNPPVIEKDAHVNYTSQKTGQTTDYKHATLANVTESISKALSADGLSASWIQGQTDKGISVTCKITHVLGHSESTTLTAAADSSGGKNSIQAVGSTNTYLQRYTLLSLTGLATREQDDDGQRSDIEYVDEDQIQQLNLGIEATKTSLEKFLKYMKVESLDKIEAKYYQKAIDALEAKKGAGQ